MTNREFYNLIASGTINDEVKAFAADAIAKLDARNAARADKPTKAQLENAPIKEALVKLFTENPDKQYTENDLGAALVVSHNKAGSLARQLVAEGKVISVEAKFPKVGKRKVYSLAK